MKLFSFIRAHRAGRKHHIKLCSPGDVLKYITFFRSLKHNFAKSVYISGPLALSEENENLRNEEIKKRGKNKKNQQSRIVNVRRGTYPEEKNVRRDYIEVSR